MKIGFIGQGWIGKHYADDFEKRGYEVVRYGLEKAYAQNKEKISLCDIVFVAVPTPTTPDGFDISVVRSVLPLVGKGKTAVIKSTILPGTTEELQKEFAHCFVLHSPEFLVEATAAWDAAHPMRNIVGIPLSNAEYRKRAKAVLSVLSTAPYAKVMSARSAEFVKYAGNCFLYTKVVFMNLLHDFVSREGGDWEDVRDALVHDHRIGKSHTEPNHAKGRGAGGNCFIKDFEAFRRRFDERALDPVGSAVLATLKDKNMELLSRSGKDLPLLRAVYGDLGPNEPHAKRNDKPRRLSREVEQGAKSKKRERLDE